MSARSITCSRSPAESTPALESAKRCPQASGAKRPRSCGPITRKVISYPRSCTLHCDNMTSCQRGISSYSCDLDPSTSEGVKRPGIIPGRRPNDRWAVNLPLQTRPSEASKSLCKCLYINGFCIKNMVGCRVQWLALCQETSELGSRVACGQQRSPRRFWAEARGGGGWANPQVNKDGVRA